MEWTDEGIVIGVRRHGESSAILEVMTRTHGRHLGLVRGGAGSRQRPILQPGNTVRANWRARLDEHLGHYAIEGLRLRAGDLMGSAYAVYGITHLAALCRLLPERDPHESVHDLLGEILDHIDDRESTAAAVVRFELTILGECGFSLDLDSCAATGTRDDLIYVSPKSGRAVSRAAGAPWHHRLLRLPAFLRDDEWAHTHLPHEDVTDAYALTGFFLTRHVLEPRGLVFADARHALLSALRSPCREDEP